MRKIKSAVINELNDFGKSISRVGTVFEDSFGYFIIGVKEGRQVRIEVFEYNDAFYTREYIERNGLANKIRKAGVKL